MELDLPDWLPGWCGRRLGARPVEVLFGVRQTSTVYGLRLADGTCVVVKARPDDGRAAACVAAQLRLAERGLPVRAAAHRGGRCRLARRARRGVPARWRGPARRLGRGGRPLRRGLRPADGRTGPTGRTGRRRAAAESAVGRLGPCRARGVARDRGTRRTRPECCARTGRRRRPAGAPADAGRRPSRACSATPTSRRRTSGGTAPTCGPCTTGTAWPGNRRRRWRDRPAARSPAPGRRRWRRSRARRRSWRPTRTSAGAGSPPWRREVAWAASLWLAAHNARWEALHGAAPRSGDTLREQASERLRRAGA